MAGRTETLKDTIVAAASLGGDADTIAAITGGLAGALYGYGAILEEWLVTLDKESVLQIDRLVEAATISRSR